MSGIDSTRGEGQTRCHAGGPRAGLGALVLLGLLVTGCLGPMAGPSTLPYGGRSWIVDPS
jgi:hypothetical protein